MIPPPGRTIYNKHTVEKWFIQNKIKKEETNVGLAWDRKSIVSSHHVCVNVYVCVFRKWCICFCALQKIILFGYSWWMWKSCVWGITWITKTTNGVRKSPLCQTIYMYKCWVAFTNIHTHTHTETRTHLWTHSLHKAKQT